MKITPKNIKSFIEGNFKYLYSRYIGFPEHIQEQVAFRISKCNEDCLLNNKCVYCGCTADKKILVNQSCNHGDRFPNMMDAELWEMFKEKNNE